MRLLLSVCLALMVLAGCNSDHKIDGAGNSSDSAAMNGSISTGSPAKSVAAIEIKPYETLAQLPKQGSLMEIHTDPMPGSDGAIRLGSGERLKILVDDPPQKIHSSVPVVRFKTDTATIVPPEGGGQHIEILIDDIETTARTVEKFPFEIDVPLSNGPHLIRMYLRADDDECVKSTKQVGCYQVNINMPPNGVDFNVLPTIVCTQPLKQTDASMAVLDFVLHGVPVTAEGDLLDKYTVVAGISDESGSSASVELAKWQPSRITNLTSGKKYTVTLQLKKDGTDINSKFAHTTRTFTVK